MNSIFLRSSDDSEISDDRAISFDFKLPKDGEAIDISTIDKYKTEVSNPRVNPDDPVATVARVNPDDPVATVVRVNPIDPFTVPNDMNSDKIPSCFLADSVNRNSDFGYITMPKDMLYHNVFPQHLLKD